MTSDQAMAGLSAIVGGGGLSAVIVSVFAYLTEARKGRKPAEGSVSISVGDAYGQTRWAEVQAGHLGALVAILARMAAIRRMRPRSAWKAGNSATGSRARRCG